MNSLLEEHPDRVALVAGDRSLTCARLADRAGAIAGGLAELGFRRGDVLALWLPNVPEWLELLFACARLGVCVAAVNTRYRSAELLHVLRTTRARGIVLAPGFLDVDWNAILDEVRPGLPDLQFVMAPWEVPTGAHLPDAGRREDLVALFTTSGTTSSPKIAGHKQGAVERHAREVARAFDIRGGESALVALPLCGVFGFSSALGALAAGATCVLQDVFEAGESARLLARYEIEHFNGSDAMLSAVLKSPELDPERLRWRRGGFANFTNLAAPLVARADAAGVRLGGVFGMSEVFALMATWDPGDPPELRALAGGRPICPDIEVRACDPDTGSVQPDEQPGELQVRGYNVIQRYLHNEAATAAAFTEDGWFRTGDLGEPVDLDEVGLRPRFHRGPQQRQRHRGRAVRVGPQRAEELDRVRSRLEHLGQHRRHQEGPVRAAEDRAGERGPVRLAGHDAGDAVVDAEEHVRRAADVEERHRDHALVAGLERPAVMGVDGVLDHVGVGEHHALGVPGRAGGVHHQADVLGHDVGGA